MAKSIQSDEVLREAIGLIGPPGCGKGAAGNEIANRFPDVVRVGLGKLTEQRLEKESEFRRLFGDDVIKGNLLPDHVAIPMTRMHYAHLTSQNPSSRVCLDAIFRTDVQVKDLTEDGLVSPEHSRILCFVASRKTCKERYMHRIKNGHGGQRIDNDSFENRFDKYELHLNGVLRAFARYGMHVTFVNAEGDINHLTKVVAPAIADFAEAFWNRNRVDKAPAVMPTAINVVRELTARQRVERVNTSSLAQLAMKS